MLFHKGHGKPVDWWALGIFIYELLVGVDPFSHDDPLQVYKNILNGKVKFHKSFDNAGKSLVKKLLQEDLSKRYGNLKNGARDIRSHRFFHNLDFNKLLNMELKPPYIPRVVSPCDITNFPMIADSKEDAPGVDPKDDPFIQWW